MWVETNMKLSVRFLKKKKKGAQEWAKWAQNGPKIGFFKNF